MIAGLLFGAAALTDLFDGRLARKNDQVTTFGKFMDPIADKLLISGALVAFVQQGLCSAWVVIVILAREFLVTSLRLIAAGEGRVLAAGIWGKVKTVTQITAVVLVFLLEEFAYIGCPPGGFPRSAVEEVFLWIAAAATLISGAVYLWQNRDLLRAAK